MTENPAHDLARALDDLGRAVAKRRPPGHREARAVLVPLGLLVLEGSAEGLTATLERLAGLVEGCAEAWEQAVDAELRMAATEHVQSVDPRYLDLPNYDFAYTVQARERLEARLRAAEVLGLPVPEDLLERVAAADERLEPYLERLDGPGGETV